jgi:hypothetical protein
MTLVNNRQTAEWTATLTTVSDLRAAAVGGVQSMACKAILPAVYHWPTITGLTAVNAMANVDVLVRATELLLGAEANARSKALILGVTRAVAVAMWNITENEIKQVERTVPMATFVNNAATWVADRAEAGNATAALTNAEKLLVPFLMHMAAPMVALQGLSLVETDHNFVASTLAYFNKHKDHVLKTASGEMRAFVTGLGVDFTDMLFDKACHSISDTVKMGIARDAAVGPRLRAANCPTAAIRFPAVPGEVKAARAALAVLTRATCTVAAMGGTVSVVNLNNMMNALSAAATPEDILAASTALANTMEALKPSVAYCAGIVRQELEVAGIANSTLMLSHYIRRLIDEYTSHVGEGAAIAKALRAKTREGLEKGTILARTIQ